MSIYSIKIASVLRQFDVWTLNRLEKFIKSPYYNVNDRLTSLYMRLSDLIKTDAPEEKWPGKADLWQEMYKNEEYSDSRLRKYFSDLLRLVEEFLIVEDLHTKPLKEVSHLLNSISINRLKILENQAVKTAKTRSKRAVKRSAEFYYNQYKIEKELYILEEYEIKRMEKLNVEKILGHLDKFYFAEKLRFYYKILSQKNVAEYRYEILFLDEIMAHIEDRDYTDEPHIHLHFLVVKLALDPYNEDIFEQVKQGILDYIDIFPQTEARDLYNAALNFCIRQLNRGKTAYLDEIFQLYQASIKDRTIFLNNEITPNTFRNIVITGLRLDQFDWVESFIKNYADNLNEKYRSNAVNFSTARLYYYRKEYERVIPLLSRVEFSEMSYTLGAKALLLATYYELNEVAPLHSFIDSFRTFLNRNKDKITLERWKNYHNLIGFVRKLSDVMPFEEDKIQKIQEEIDNAEGIADIQWLKEKVQELRNTKR